MASHFDKELYNLTVSINKALNPMEAPLKMKHARSVIITTHRMKEAKSFWIVVTRQALMENRFTAWKFCHLLHKVLREGHESALKQSQSHKKMVLEMGKLWGHLQDGVGSCIQAYSKLLVTKLEFHDKNAIFPGSLLMDFREIEKAAGEDINVYFQLCVEIFDYLDDIIEVQLRVFTSVNSYRMSSMTPQGQCRLAPLITLIQDSNPLYDLCVRIMFKLHDKLPNDILNGHRDRFREMFVKVKLFYDNVRPLQYFFDLIQVPHLPDAAPNFTSKVDFGSYIPPVMYVQPDPEPPMENLVDTSALQETNITPQNVNLNQSSSKEREVIAQLEDELSSVKQAFKLMESNYEKEINQLRDDLSTLSIELSYSKDVCQNIQSLKQDLEQQVAETTIILQKREDDESKVKASEEKFSKLKIMYSQIRDEHINLLRQHGESTKSLNNEKRANLEMKKEIENLNIKIKNLESLEANRVEDLSNKNLEMNVKLEGVASKYEALLETYEQLQRDYTELVTTKDSEIEKLSLKTLHLQKDSSALEESKGLILNLEKSLNEVTESLNAEKNKSTAVINTLQEELQNKTTEFVDLRRSLENKVEQRDGCIKELQDKQFTIQQDLKESKSTAQVLLNEKLLLETELQKSLEGISNLEKKLKTADQEINSHISKQRENEIINQAVILSLLKKSLETLKFISTSKVEDDNVHNFEKALKFTTDLEQMLKEIKNCYHKMCEDNNSIEGLIQQSILFIYSFTMLHEQCLSIYNTTTSIDKGRDIFQRASSLCDQVVKLLGLVSNVQGTEMLESCIGTVKCELAMLRNLINDLMMSSSSHMGIENLVENELAEMDKAIEDAAEKFVQMLSNLRSKDKGIKLEVNEKILDACTILMECIKALIHKSKTLQEEIVSAGRGSTSVKEFYKRNSQWTEGLISASKSVAKGANLLVEAANKAVSSENNQPNQHFEIIVAAQEIAACTAQLVIASKVKAPKESSKLLELTKASRNVSQATGAVVATVKDCSQQLEQSQEIDFTKLTASQAKTMEMDIHVKVLELEQALQSERFKLSSFRRNHYQNNDE